MPKLPPWLSASAVAALGVVGTSCSLVHHVHNETSEKIEHFKDELVAVPPPKVHVLPSMSTLAHDLDCLEQQIDWYGSVVAKAGDVWGEARLTRHREEFEKEIVKDLSEFEEKINASESRADLALVTQAFALSVAAKGGTLSVTSPTEGLKPAPSGGAKDLSTEVQLEPTLFLSQKNRYLNFLNQLRRTNEGDDNADSPGYSLNLVRIPVSLLPGKRTQQGYGAEITFTLEPILSDELLPMTTRTLLASDLVDAFSAQLAATLLDPKVRKAIADYKEAERVEEAEEKNKQRMSLPKMGELQLSAFQDNKVSNSSATARDNKSAANSKVQSALKTLYTVNSRTASQSVRQGSKLEERNILRLAGDDYSFTIIKGAYEALQLDDKKEISYIHLPHIQAYLKAQIGESQRFLTSDIRQSLWTNYATRELAQAYRSNDKITVDTLRTAYKNSLATPNPDLEKSITAAMAWCLIANGAIFTEELLDDIRQTSASRNQPLSVPSWSDIAAPNPSPESRRLFNDYVRIRWPIRVFALDPMTQDQNIEEATSNRREKQLALSVAFVSGRVNASRFMRESRTLELEANTISINRTEVGFSHGENTFGWRFYPRYQVPTLTGGIPGYVNQELFGGLSEPERLRQRTLEPGPRECVAIVMMPAFVPYLTCDSFGNWFSLANPKHKVFDHTQALHLGKRIKLMETHGPNVHDAEHYRDGDFQRMLRRVKQLDARMPSQTVSVPVPVRDNLNASDLLTSGTAALAPELTAFFGAPGIDLAKPRVVLFLMGDHFRTGQTWITIGNNRAEKRADSTQGLPNYRMLSRQVLQITIDTTGIVVDEDGFAHIHVATPYGVTQGLKIPTFRSDAAPKKEAKAEGYDLKTPTLKINYAFTRKGDRIEILPDDISVGSNPAVLRLQALDNLGTVADALELGLSVDLGNRTEGTLSLGGAKVVRKSEGVFDLSGADLTQLCKDIVKKYVDAVDTVPEATNPLAETKKVTISVLPKMMDWFTDRSGRTVAVPTKLDVEFYGTIKP